jgi:hypothetical protein
MDVKNFDEIWKRIPPEEKLEMSVRAHSFGAIIAFFLFLILSGLAIGFKTPWLLWGGLAISPFIFQIASERDWKKRRSNTVLSYLAARSAVRRFAYNLNCFDLEVLILFRGKVKKLSLAELSGLNTAETLSKDPFNDYELAWVALFRDAIVVIAEGEGGAQLQFMHLLNDKLDFKVEELVIGGNANKVLEFSTLERKASKETFLLVSPKMPAALLALEQKINSTVFSTKPTKIAIE